VNIHRRQTKPDFLRRLLATGCAALIFTLGLLSASPALHAWVHHAASTADHHSPNGSSPIHSEA